MNNEDSFVFYCLWEELSNSDFKLTESREFKNNSAGREKIFGRLELIKTTTNPNEENIASNNYEELNGNVVDTIISSFIYDTKGRIAKHFGIITGVAAIFTTG